MTTPSNTLLTTGGSAVVGMREDLADYVSMIDPEEVPFYSWAGRGTAKSSTAHDWQTVTLRAPEKNAQAEGDQFSPSTAKRSTRLSNACQISSEVASVSGTSEAVDTAGNTGSLDFQLMLKGIEIRRDIEKGTLLANQDQKLTDPRECAGLPTWAGTALTGAGGTDPTANGATAYVNGTTYDLAVDRLNDVLKSMWIKGARPDLMMMHPSGKLVFDELSAGSNLVDNQVNNPRGGEVGVDFVVTVAVYKSAFGAMKLTMNQWLEEDEIFIFGRQQFKPKVCPLPGRNFVKGNPQLNHDGRSQAVIWEGTLEVPNPNAIGLITSFDTNVPS
jgi:hypothetical protein